MEIRPLLRGAPCDMLGCVRPAYVSFERKWLGGVARLCVGCAYRLYAEGMQAHDAAEGVGHAGLGPDDEDAEEHFGRRVSPARGKDWKV